MRLLDHLVGEHEQVMWNSETERLGGCQVDTEIEFGRLLDRDIGRLRPAQNFVDNLGSAPEQVSDVRSIGGQAVANRVKRQREHDRD